MTPITAGTIKAAGAVLSIAAMLGMGFWAGYSWQSDNVEEAKQEASEARTQRDRWQANAESYSKAIADQKTANEAAIKAAQDQQAKADKATREANAERDKYQKRLAEIEAGVEHDKTDPSCKAELERPVCGAPWR